jgi:hypothetical protein
VDHFSRADPGHFSRALKTPGERAGSPAASQLQAPLAKGALPLDEDDAPPPVPVPLEFDELLVAHWLPTHVCPPAQVPHITIPPQPSGVVPQGAPAAQAVFGTHATVTTTDASAPSASRARTWIVPLLGPAVNTPVVSTMFEHVGEVAVLQVVSAPVYHLIGATPPVDVKVSIPPGLEVGVNGWIAKEIGPKASGTLADVDGRCVASPVYIATTSTDCMPGLTSPGGTAPVMVAVPAAVVPPALVPVPSVQERSGLFIAS